MNMEEGDRLSERFVTQSDPASRSMAEFDEAAYRPYLEAIDLTDVQKSDFLLIVWDIMRMWVEMDLPLDSCGQMIEAIIDPDTFDSVEV